MVIEKENLEFRAKFKWKWLQCLDPIHSKMVIILMSKEQLLISLTFLEHEEMIDFRCPVYNIT